MQQVTVSTSIKLSKALTDLVTSYIKKEFGESSVSFTLDSSLIAGIKIVGTDKQVELSLNDFLDNLGKSL